MDRRGERCRGSSAGHFGRKGACCAVQVETDGKNALAEGEIRLIDAAEEQIDGSRSNALPIDSDACQRGQVGIMLADMVDAGHGDILGNAKTGGMQRGHGVIGQFVVKAKDGGVIQWLKQAENVGW